MKEYIHFSPREKDVLLLLLEGLTDKQISIKIGMSYSVVKQRMVSIRQKLNVESSKQVIIKMMSNHKGQVCGYKPIICQEGYCPGCQIFLDSDHKTTNLKKEESWKV